MERRTDAECENNGCRGPRRGPRRGPAADLPATAQRLERPGVPGGKRAENRKQKVAAILDAAVDAFLERGVEAVTIDAIAKGAGVAKGSFYQYFSGKHELLATLFAPLFVAIRTAMHRADAAVLQAKEPAEMQAAYEELGADLTHLVLVHDRETLLYLREVRRGHPVIAPFYDEVSAHAVEMTQTAHAAGLLRADIPATTSAALLLGAIEHLAFSALSGRDLGDVTRLGDDVVGTLLDGLRPLRA